MDWEEHLMLIAHSVNKFGNQLVVVGNTGSNNTREAIKGTKHGFAFGMDAALQINPYYGKASNAGLKEHFKRVLDLGPSIIYNVPGRTGQDIQPDLIEEGASFAEGAGRSRTYSHRNSYYGRRWLYHYRKTYQFYSRETVPHSAG